MEVLIFKTDIATKDRIHHFEWIFDQHPDITHWNIDYQDVDKVLRIEASKGLKEDQVIDLVKTFGFYCEILPD